LPFAYWRAIKPHFDAHAWVIDGTYFRDFLRKVPTFAGITLMATALRFAAPLLLPWALNDAAAGQFGAAYIFIELVLLVPTALTINLIPVLTRHSQGPGDQLRESCRQCIKTMALGVIPVVAILSAVSLPLFMTVFPGKADYALSASVLQVVIWICVLQAIDQVLSSAILAKGQQHIDLLTLMIGTVAMVTLLAVFVPLWGVVGAAYGVLGGYGAVLITRIILVGRRIGGLDMPNLLWRPVAAGVVAIVVTKTLAAHWYWMIGAVAGGLAYLATIAALGAFSRSERQGILRLLQAEKA
jgi:O-antigen/teichoic acid export membrane protein